jgi:putative flippase GtrA
VVYQYGLFSLSATDLTASALLVFALGLVGLIVNLLVIRLGVEAVQLSVIHAKLAASVCSFGVNFALRRALLFSPAAPSRETQGI